MKQQLERWCFGLLLVASAGCTRAVRLDEMSAAAHKQEAKREFAVAGAHVAAYDPVAVGVAPASALDQPEGPIRARVPGYNPTEWHLKEAARAAQHARQHRQAAEQLEDFEEGACAAFEPRERAACPFFGPIRAVELIEHGVRLRLERGTPVTTMVAHVNCHLAYARARGFEIPSCPLMLRGVEAVSGADGVSIELSSRDGKIVRELQRRARDIEAGATL